MKKFGLAMIGMIGLAASVIIMVNANSLNHEETLTQNASMTANLAVYPLPGNPKAAVTIRAQSGESIKFMNQNGRKVHGKPAVEKYIPRLVLFRSGALTDPIERTLVLSIEDLAIPTPGAWLTVRAVTEHSDPGEDFPSDNTFTIIQTSHWISPTSGSSITYRFEIGGRISSDGNEVVTPTDYYQIDVEISRDKPGNSSPAEKLTIEYAFLLENEWQASLPEVPEAADGASPDYLTVHYCDMTPYQYTLYDPNTKLRRAEVTPFIAQELIPMLIDAYQRMGNQWGFVWYEAWISSRAEGNREALSIAVTDGKTWYHGKAPMAGFSGISITVAPGYDENANYTSMTQKIRGTLQHELFHNYQRSLAMHFTGKDSFAGADGAWSIFSEGTATMAPTVFDLDHQLSPDSGIHGYMTNAAKYIAEDLNRSYREMDPYHAALYWRFLYEQCSGLGRGQENPDQGMQVIRSVLETLYSGVIVDIQTSQQIVEYMPKIIDHGLAGSPCAVDTFQESLLAFTRAIYALRFEENLRLDASFPIHEQLADPHGAYPQPAIETVKFDGTATVYSGGIGSSYGMDFIEVILDRGQMANPVELTFSAPGGSTAFAIQVMTLSEDLHPILLGNEGIVFSNGASGGGTNFTVHVDNHANIRRIALLITRIDVNEASDTLGAYQIQSR